MEQNTDDLLTHLNNGSISSFKSVWNELGTYVMSVGPHPCWQSHILPNLGRNQPGVASRLHSGTLWHLRGFFSSQIFNSIAFETILVTRQTIWSSHMKYGDSNHICIPCNMRVLRLTWGKCLTPILIWKNQGRSSHHELTDLTCRHTSCLGLPWTVIGQVKAHISYLPCCPGLAGTHGSGLVSVLRQ